jgi:hypothetical protein
MNQLLFIVFALLLVQCSTSSGSGDKPTEADITASMKKTWETGETSTRPKSTITINSMQIGTSDESNYAQQLDGIPKNTTVTHAKIDFTQHEHYTDGVKDVRRVMTALVYKDQFNEWTCMNAGVKYIE